MTESLWNARPSDKPGWAKKELDRLAAEAAQVPAWLLPKGGAKK